MDELLSSQKNILGIGEFLDESKLYISDTFPNLNLENLFTEAIKGGISTNFWTGTIFDLISNELKDTIQLMISVLIVIIIHTILKSVIENLGNNATSRVVYLIQYLIIVSLICESFVGIVDIIRNSIQNIVDFMNLLIPLLTTLMLTTGCITSTSIIQPVIIFMVSFIGNFINEFIIPLVLVIIVFCVISNISEQVQINKLTKFLKSSVVWIIGIIITVFVCSLSIEGTLSSSIDGLTAKTAKSAVSTFIPVVGKILGDSVDSIMGCANILKNAVGIIGVVIITGIVVVPIIKVTVIWASFCLLSGVCEMIADVRIVKLFSQIADCYKILLALLLSVSVMFIIGITLVLKITNSVMMYK